MIKTITDAALQTPWWAYVLFVYLIIVGVKASKTTIVSARKLFILPIIFTVMSIHTVFTSFQIDATIIFIWIGSIIIESLIGWVLVQHQKIQIDKTHLLIQLPGTWLTLILVLVIFAAKYYFGYELSVDPQLIKQTAFEFSMLFISGACTGLFIGRVCFYSHQLYALKSVNLAD